MDSLLEYFYGYGTEPLWPVLWSLKIIIAFGVIWGVIGWHERRNERDNTWDGIKLLLSGIMLSFHIFLSGTKLLINPPKIPGPKRFLKEAMFVVEKSLGAIFFILFTVAVTATVIRIGGLG